MIVRMLIVLFGAIAAGAAVLPPLLDSRRYLVGRPFSRKVYRPVPGVMPGVEKAALVVLNSYGIRGGEIPRDAARRIVIVGDSVIENLVTDQREMVGSVVSRELEGSVRGRVWVGCIGRSNLASRHCLLVLRHTVSRIPVDTVVMPLGVSDLIERLKSDIEYRPLTVAEIDRDVQTYSETFRLWPRPDGTLSRIRGSMPVWGAKIAWWSLRGWLHTDISPKTGAFYGKRRANRRDALRVRQRLPDMGGALAEFDRNVTEMIRIARRQPVRLVLASEPALWCSTLPACDEQLLWLGGVGPYREGERREFYSPAALARGLTQFHRKLAEVCVRERAEYLDLAGRLPQDTSVFYDDVHWNPLGSAMAAKIIAAYLLSPVRDGTLASAG
jgi:hypothetical protein